MAEERIEDQIKTMLADRFIVSLPPDEIDEEISLVDAYDVDSVSVLELIVGLEEAFGISVGNTDFSIDNFQTVSAIADFVRSRQE